ncbi:hypothetical protein BASA62_001038 [Batrachochytrium salamandrivorans]|nr:hypothetical protein BASA62_001038 [Batrachochytrium salamandrivorans]
MVRRVFVVHSPSSSASSGLVSSGSISGTSHLHHTAATTKVCGICAPPDLDWNDSALRAQFYFGLSYEIKDALVHFDTPSTLSLAIQQAIKVDNRLYERRLERTEVRGVTPYSSPNRFFPPTRPQPPTPRTSNTPWHQTPRRPPPPSPMVVPSPRSSNDMDIDFARRGPLTSEERQQRMNRGLCLVCGQSGHLKANCPKSNPNFRAPKLIRAIQIDDVDFESPGNDPGCL